MRGFWGDEHQNHESLPALVAHAMVLPGGSEGHFPGAQFFLFIPDSKYALSFYDVVDFVLTVMRVW